MSTTQEELFKLIKLKLIGKESLANALSDILHISPDAVYRRYRGETSLTIDEIKRLCIHFDISFDFLIQANSGQAIFNYQPLNSFDFRLESYLEGILNSLRHLKSLSEPHFILNTKKLSISIRKQVKRHLLLEKKYFSCIHQFLLQKFLTQN